MKASIPIYGDNKNLLFVVCVYIKISDSLNIIQKVKIEFIFSHFSLLVYFCLVLFFFWISFYLHPLVFPWVFFVLYCGGFNFFLFHTSPPPTQPNGTSSDFSFSKNTKPIKYHGNERITVNQIYKTLKINIYNHIRNKIHSRTNKWLQIDK
ncbi:hypothetical protein ACISNR_09315, partial [Campylobacter jejuni]